MLCRPVLLSFILLSALLIMTFSMSGCGEEEQPTASEIGAEGWELYEARDYSGSLEKFNEAVSTDPDYADAYVGLGWAYGKMAQLTECVSSFRTALSKDAQNVDALAGIALAYLADDEYDQAIAKASQLLAISPDYSFEHGSVTSRNLHLVLAESYYYTGDLAKAQSEVDILNPGNELDSSSEDYAARLLEELERTSGG